jgi:hypothetical protein
MVMKKDGLTCKDVKGLEKAVEGERIVKIGVNAHKEYEVFVQWANDGVSLSSKITAAEAIRKASRDFEIAGKDPFRIAQPDLCGPLQGDEFDKMLLLGYSFKIYMRKEVIACADVYYKGYTIERIEAFSFFGVYKRLKRYSRRSIKKTS